MIAFDDKLITQVPVVVLDTETTGLHPGLGHRVVEVAAVRLENWQEVGQLSQLINPGRAMDPGASQVNGIHDEDLVGAPTFGDILPQLAPLLSGALLVAHNATFDASFLGMEYAIVAQQQPGRAVTLPNPWLCTLQLARHHFYFGKNSLGHVARQLGVRTGQAHRALNDVYTTIQILRRMTQLLTQRRLRTVGDLLNAQGGAIYVPAPAPAGAGVPLSIRAALATQTTVRIRYRSKQGETIRLITPRYVSELAGITYLVAYCHLRQEQRTFRLDRIEAVDPAG